MSDNWTFDDLKRWDDIIIKKAKEYDLDWHPINSECEPKWFGALCTKMT